jgi:hypothetical protein
MAQPCRLCWETGLVKRDMNPEERKKWLRRLGHRPRPATEPMVTGFCSCLEGKRLKKDQK